MYNQMSGCTALSTALTLHLTNHNKKHSTHPDFPLQSLRHTNQGVLKNNSLSVNTSYSCQGADTFRGKPESKKQ